MSQTLSPSSNLSVCSSSWCCNFPDIVGYVTPLILPQTAWQSVLPDNECWVCSTHHYQDFMTVLQPENARHSQFKMQIFLKSPGMSWLGMLGWNVKEEPECSPPLCASIRSLRHSLPWRLPSGLCLAQQSHPFPAGVRYSDSSFLHAVAFVSHVNHWVFMCTPIPLSGDGQMGDGCIRVPLREQVLSHGSNRGPSCCQDSSINICSKFI